MTRSNAGSEYFPPFSFSHCKNEKKKQILSGEKESIIETMLAPLCLQRCWNKVMYDWQLICSQDLHVLSCIKVQQSLNNREILLSSAVWFKKIALKACGDGNWAVEVWQVCKSLEWCHRKSKLVHYFFLFNLIYKMKLDPNHLILHIFVLHLLCFIHESAFICKSTP